METEGGKETEAGEIGGGGWEWGCLMFVDSVYSAWWGPKVSDDKMALNSILDALKHTVVKSMSVLPPF